MAKLYKDYYIFSFLWISALLAIIATFALNKLREDKLKITLLSARKIVDMEQENVVVHVQEESENINNLVRLLIIIINNESVLITKLHLIAYLNDYYGLTPFWKIVQYLYAKALLKESIDYKLVDARIKELPEIIECKSDLETYAVLWCLHRATRQKLEQFWLGFVSFL